MHARELVELAAIVSAHGPVLVRGTRRLSSSGVQQYWTESKCRLGALVPQPADLRPRGGRSRLRRRPPPVALCPQRPGRNPHQRNAHPRLGDRALRLRPAAGHARSRTDRAEHHDRAPRSAASGVDVAGPRAGRRCGSGRPPEPPAAADRTLDRPVGRLPGRAGHGRRNSPSSPPGRTTSPATCGCNRLAPADAMPGRWCFPRCGRPIAKGSRPSVPTPISNAGIATAILSCFPAELFDSTGQFRSLWLLRLVERDRRRPRDDRRVALPRAGVGPAGRIAGDGPGPRTRRFRR